MNRLERLITVMQKKGLEALLVTHPVNRRYLTGFTGTSGYVLITAEQALLFTDFRYVEQAGNQVEHFQVVEHGADFKQELKQKLSELKVRALAFEEQHVSYGEYLAYKRAISDVEWVPTSGVVEELRVVKDAEELQVMKEAAKVADDAFRHILTVIRPGMKEMDISLELEIFMRKRGAESSSFDTIVASGERSALPHGIASERIIRNNEFVKMDFGAYYKGYCSDITRTVFVGEPTAKHREIFDIVLEAQMYAVDKLGPGMTGQEGDALARDIIKKHGYGDHFGHSTGHGLGMEIHEMPRLSPKSDTVLEPGMVVTVEPGIYIPGFGGVRIEDDMVITEKGAERLTHSAKDWIQL